MLKTSKVIAQTWANDDEIASIFIITWIENIQINWSLVKNESIIEVINKRLMTKQSQLKIKHDENLSIILVIDHRVTLKNYV
jgi:MFS-type transporter involved in bile tolerance (Atg22 family)